MNKIARCIALLFTLEMAAYEPSTNQASYDLSMAAGEICQRQPHGRSTACLPATSIQ